MLAPNTDLVRELLTNFLWSWATFNRAALSARHTDLFAPSDPPPDWFASLKTAMDDLRGHATDWLRSSAAQAVIAIPQAFIDYANQFAPIAGGLAAATADQQLVMIDNLIAQAGAARDATKASEQAMADFKSLFSAKITTLAAAQDAARVTLGQDETLASALAARITQILASVGVDSQAAEDAMMNATSGGVSLVTGVMYFSVASALAAGPASPLVGLAVAVIGITVAAVEQAADEKKISDALGQVASLQPQLTALQQQSLALQSMIAALGTLDDALANATVDVGLQPIWAETISDLTALRARIAAGTAAATLTELVTLADAATRWTAILDMAANVERTIVDSQSIGPIVLTATAKATS